MKYETTPAQAREMNQSAPKGLSWCRGHNDFILNRLFVPGSTDGLCKRCRSARRHASAILRTYGITDEQYWAIHRAQGGRCAICQRATGKSKRLAVDHDHETGEVRGLLCKTCNHDILGKLDRAGLERALAYLDDPPARKVLNG